MSTLSPRGLAVVRAGQLALRPTEEDRARLLAALVGRLTGSRCCPSWGRWRPRPPRAGRVARDHKRCFGKRRGTSDR